MSVARLIRWLPVAVAFAATGCSDGTGEGEAPLRVAWHFSSAAACGAVAPASDGVRVFVGLTNGNVRALDLATGATVWETPLGTAFFSDLKVWGSTLLVQRGRGVMGLSVANGSAIWATPAGTDTPGGTLALDTGQALVVTGGADSVVFGVRLTNGTYAWSVNIGEASLSAVVAGRTVYLGTRNMQAAPADATGHIVAVNLDGAGELWRFLAPRIVVSSGFAGPLFVSNGVVFGNAATGRTYAVNATTGQELWHFYGAAWLAGPIADASYVYVPSMTGILYALHRATGAVVWSRDLQHGSLYTEPVFFDPSSVLIKAGPMLFLLSRANGSVIWSHSIGFNNICRGPTLAGGKILVDAEDGIYALEVRDH
jgi:outer membrane protein assembly factor BamB